MTLTILEGSTFCVCDELGDLHEATAGLFAHDTRFLSRWMLTVNGARPLLLSSDRVDYFSAAFFLRNPAAGGLGLDELSIARERFVGDGMQDHLVVQNHSRRRIEFELAFELGERLRGHLRREGLGLLARRSGTRIAAPGPRARGSRSGRQRDHARGHDRVSGRDAALLLRAG